MGAVLQLIFRSIFSETLGHYFLSFNFWAALFFDVRVVNLSHDERSTSSTNSSILSDDFPEKAPGIGDREMYLAPSLHHQICQGSSGTSLRTVASVRRHLPACSFSPGISDRTVLEERPRTNNIPVIRRERSVRDFE